MNKKGQIFEQLGQLGIAIAGLAIILVVAFLILSQGKTQTVSQITPTTISSEVVSNTTASTLANACVAATCVAHNASAAGPLIPASNYTCTVNTGGSIVTWTPIMGAYPGSNGTVFVNYTCSQPSAAWNGTVEMQNATSTIPPWIPLIVITVIGGLLIGLIRVFRRR